MKLKTWLLASYFLVMIIPLLASYLLFAWISSFNNAEMIEKHLIDTRELDTLITELNDPALYVPKEAKRVVDEFSSNQRFITIYNYNGIVLYSSNPLVKLAQVSVNKEVLYKGLYSVEQGYRMSNYKQPVFEGTRLVGFFHIETAREEWTKGVKNRSYLTFGIFVFVFLTVYLLVVFLINRKLNHRLTALKEEMSAFARGEQVRKTVTNNDEIAELKKHFYAMCTQITEAQEIIAEEQVLREYMVATISHDLKTPLTSIKAYTEAIGNELTKEEQTEYLAIVMEKADFMKSMLDDLLTYTILQSPTHEMEFVSVEGGEFFDMLLSDYETLGAKKCVKIHSLVAVCGTYDVNPKQMIRVVDNLVTNAIQHTPVGGEIWISAFSEAVSDIPNLFDFVKQAVRFNLEKYTYLIVQNEGEGIAASKLARILEPLYQIDEARSKQDDYGTGLGLSITKQIMKKHGGDVKVLSRQHVGTAVICRIPKRS